MYATSTGTSTVSSSIAAFKIDPATGVLTAIAGFPQTVAGASFNSMSVDPQGNFLLFTNPNGVEVYPIDASTGALGTAVVGSPFATSSNQCAANPYSVRFDATGSFV